MIIEETKLQDYFEANKQAWNKRTWVHKNSDFYDIDSFKAGKTSLNKPELEEVGDVKGKSLLHLQCHFGMDTLSWAREGATVTGVDFSEDAIFIAKQLGNELQVSADFICCNVYDLPQYLNQKFDIVFASYGVIGWLPDLNKWAEVIAHFLKPGGMFYLIEFHPVVWMMDENFEHIKYAYYNAETIAEKQSGTYADPQSAIEYEEFSWNHSLSEVMSALINKGLKIQHFNEFYYSCYNCFKNLVKGTDGFWRVKGLEEKMPMMYSLKATLFPGDAK